MDEGLWMKDCGRRIVDEGLWMKDCGSGLLIVDSRIGNKVSNPKRNPLPL